MADTFKYAQLQNFSLAGSGAIIGATSIVLKSFTTIDGDLLTMDDFGDIGFGTLQPGEGAFEEQISFTAVTQNSNGTATIEGVSNVSFLSPYTQTSGLSKTHAGSTTFVISNTSGFYDRLTAKDDDETVTGLWTFEQPPVVPDPVGLTDAANKEYVLSVVNGGPVSINQVIEAGIAGETLIAGNLIYFSETDNEWLKTDADDIGTIFNVKLGIAQGSGVNGGAISGGVLTFGSYTTSGLTPGDLLFASNTAGAITNTPGTVPRVIGIAKDSTHLYFDPNFQSRLYDYGVDSVGTDSYAVTLSGALKVPYLGMEINFYPGTDNTGASTLAINGGSAKNIVKNANQNLQTGDILAGQIVKVVYDNSNWQLISRTALTSPVVNVYQPSLRGDSTTQFDITNPSGTTFRYTYDATGTDPVINATTFPIGARVQIYSNAFNAGNNGTWSVTGSGANYFEVTNAGGVAENNKVLDTGALYLLQTSSTWTMPDNLKYITVELCGGGGAGGAATDTDGGACGGGGGGYSRKMIVVGSLGATETYTIGAGGKPVTGTSGGAGGTSIFGSLLQATGGAGGTTNAGSGGVGGVGSSGDINSTGNGGGGATGLDSARLGGYGGGSYFGGGANQIVNTYGSKGGSYGGGGGGGATDDATDHNGGMGYPGIIIVTEYYA